MARLSLKPTVVKRLFALSGNKCAYPNCKQEIVDSDGIVLGEICHIEAAEPNGQRYNSLSTNEYRRSFENLLLMCSMHHKKTNDVKKYSVKKLATYKQEHEKKFKTNTYSPTTEVIQKSIQNYMKQENTNTGYGSQINNVAHVQNIRTQIGIQNITTIKKEKAHTLNNSRKINSIFKTEIDSVRQTASPPKETVIDYRNDLLDKHPRNIESIPFKLLKFRKENGRIKAEVDSYEKLKGKIDEALPEGQKILSNFLRDSDIEKNESLKQQIRHKTQLSPAIITCDGFLINGNRRRLIIEELFNESHEDPKYENMRVVILPDFISELDILKIENRYQLQDEGKSEYHGLNRALTIRDNENAGYRLEAQIKDDPKYHDLQGADFDRIVKKFRNDYLNPLQCVDRYLKQFQRDGIYTTISESSGDKEGRWQAFIDYSNFNNSTLTNPKIRLALGIKETEIRKIEDALFKLIRKRSLSSKELDLAFGKLHMFLRGGNLKKYLSNPVAKKSLLKIAEKVPIELPLKSQKDKNGKIYEHRKLDELWGVENEKDILGYLSDAYKAVNEKEESDKPVKLIEAAYKKLTHKGFSLKKLNNANELNRATRLVGLIGKRVSQLKRDLNDMRKIITTS